MYRTSLTVIGVLAIAAAITGCSAASEQSPEIATLQSPEASQPSPEQSESARPRARMDMTDAEETALYQPWNDCMAEQGIGGKSDGVSKPGSDMSEAEIATANVACENFMPLPPWEEDRKNPDAIDFMERVVACLHSKGVKYADVVDDPSSEQLSYSLGGPNNDSNSISLGMEVGEDCMREASQQ